ncbi:MAG: hypothetical protein PVI30_17465 [Myxococcales bacterium]|jgi:hypothetical protein
MDAAREREALLELLLELRHDLGKYLRMPLTMLPRDAGDGALREALERALLHTRTGPTGVRSAEQIFADFEAQLDGRLEGSAGLQQLRRRLQAALCWSELLEKPAAPPSPVDRAALMADLDAVSDAIDALIAEVGDD